MPCVIDREVNAKFGGEIGAGGRGGEVGEAGDEKTHMLGAMSSVI